jgi:protein arginine N-methyltransferase 1
MRLSYHQQCIADEGRVAALASALLAAIRPGDVVADLGAGTGILACLAARAGAAHVFAIERDASIELAREVVVCNGLSDRVTCLRADATTVRLERPVDVLLGDILGVFGLEDNIVPTFFGFARNNLAPQGRIVPAAIELFFAPWEAVDLHAHEVGFWSRPHHGIYLTPIGRIAANWLRSVVVSPGGRLAPDASFFRVQPGVSEPCYLRSTHVFTAGRAGTLTGLVGWFRATLFGDIALETAPERPPTVWRQGFLSLAHPVTVAPGDPIEVTVTITPEIPASALGWSVAVRGGPAQVHHQFLAEAHTIDRGADPPPPLRGRGSR